MSKQFLAIIAIVIVLLGGVFLITNNGSSSKSSSSTATPSNHVTGSASSGVRLVEYGDYECPFCGQFQPLVKQVIEQYKDRVEFQFRNLPLTQIHKNAFSAARAAEAASLQGKFWEMHDTLYDNQDPNGASGWVASTDPLNSYYVVYAKQLGLNTTQFKADFASVKVNNTINADVAAFKKTGADEATPTFFLDGKQIHPTNLADFQKAIDAEIAAKAKS